MSKLNAVIAVEPGVKSKATRQLTDLYRALKRGELWQGLSRNYAPHNEDGEQLPSESKLVQFTTDKALDDVVNVLSRLFDVTLTKEVGNTQAKADVKVGDDVLLSDVPVTYLLFLEKQLKDLHEFLTDLPVLDPALSWHFDENKGFYVSEPVQTVKTKKVLKVLVKYEATEKHPAQTETYNDDVAVGQWTKVDFSGAVPAVRKNELLERVEAVQRAVKTAREEANGLEVTDFHIGEDFLNWILR